MQQKYGAYRILLLNSTTDVGIGVNSKSFSITRATQSLQSFLIHVIIHTSIQCMHTKNHTDLHA